MPNIASFMVVSRDRDVRSQMEKLLSGMGYSLITALEDSSDARTKVAQIGPQLLMVDWDCKPLSAPALLQAVRSSAKFRHMPAVILAKRMLTADLRLYTELGIEQVLPLPLERLKTKDALRRIIDAEASLTPAQLLLRQAGDLIAAGDFSEAERKLTECHLQDLKALAPRRMLGEVLVRQERWQDAEAQLLLARQIAPRNSLIAQLLAKVYAQTQRHEQAVELLNQMVDYSPLNIGNLLGLGDTFALQADDDKASAYYRSALALDSEHGGARQGLGKLAFRSGDFETAKEYFAGTEKGADLARDFNNIAIGLVARGDFGRAEASYLTAAVILEGHPSRGIVLYNLGLAYKKWGRLKEALASLSEGYVAGFRADKVYGAIVLLATELRVEAGVNESIMAEVMRLKAAG